jgi:DNA polymerase-3 subunit delta'
MIGFENILGQQGAIDWLRAAVAAERLPHGLIFAGPVGVGKATTAAALGKLFLCEKPRGESPCGVCGSCKVFDAGNHPDFHVITKELIRFHDKTGKSKASEMSIDVIRYQLIAPAGLKAAMGHGKVFVIEQAELMTAQAQNAMLKTLEEPASRTLIILLTDQPGVLLSTIRSRCQLVRFAALPVEMVESELIRRGTDKKSASAAAKLSGGSIGIAIKWIEDGVIDNAVTLLRQLEQLLGGQPVEGLAEQIRKSAEAYAEKQLERDELTSKDQATRDGLAMYLRIASEYFRRRLPEENDSERLERIATAIDAIARAEQYLDAYVNIPLVFQQLTLALENAFVVTT